MSSTTARNEAMAEMRRDGATLEEIGAQYGITRERVRQLVGKVEIEAACEQCGARLTTRTAAKRFCSEGCYDESRRKVCVDCGCQVGPRSERCVDCAITFHAENRRKKHERMQELWDSGMPQKEMAAVLGMTPGSLSVQIARAKHEGFEFKPRRAGWKGHSRPTGAPTKDPKSHREVVARMSHAIRTGKLVRSETCERCGRVGHVDGHHHDYSKPFDVEWLCRPCHMQHHREERAALKEIA